MTIGQAAEYMGASVSTVKRHVAAGLLHWHVTGAGLKRIDREEIDGLFVKDGRTGKTGKNVVSDEEWRRYVR